MLIARLRRRIELKKSISKLALLRYLHKPAPNAGVMKGGGRAASPSSMRVKLACKPAFSLAVRLFLAATVFSANRRRLLCDVKNRVSKMLSCIERRRKWYSMP